VVTKARKLARRDGRADITPVDAMRAIDTLRPSGAGQADYFTMLAVQACNDTDLLPPRFAALLDDRATLARQIQDQEPAPRRKVDL
jgi:hypothetical protein